MSRLLGFPSPQFIHLPLLCNSAGQRLSKRDLSMDMQQLRQHHTASELTGMLAHLAGLQPQPQPVTAEKLIPLFSWKKVPHENIFVNNV